MLTNNLRMGPTGPLYRPVLGCVLIAGIVSGCASTHHVDTRQADRAAKQKRQQEHIPKSAKKELKRAQHKDKSKRRSRHTSYETPSRRHHYTPHHWPSPKEDLWARIRSQFELSPRDEQRSVRVWTEYYSTHSRHLQSALRRARPYLWHIAQETQKRGMPSELALLPIVESGYRSRIQSRSGASGMWQFMPQTADHMGITRDWWFDGRRDPITSTHAAMDYLKTLSQRYDGDWELALAAYNAGPGRVDQAIAHNKAHGRPTDFWSLNLPRETRQYVPQLLALRRIMRDPARYGVNWPSLSSKKRTQLVSLPSQTSLQVAARMLGMSKESLKKLNPGLKRWASRPSGSQELLVPAHLADNFRQKLAKADPSSLINRRSHTVSRGESLGAVAKIYGVSAAALKQANNLQGNQLQAGQTLTIPNPGSQSIKSQPSSGRKYVVKSGDTPWRIAKRNGVTVASLKQANGGQLSNLQAGQSITIRGGKKTADAGSTRVTVKSGDSIWSIARSNNVSVKQLRRWNNLNRNTQLAAGTQLSVDGPG